MGVLRLENYLEGIRSRVREEVGFSHEATEQRAQVYFQHGMSIESYLDTLRATKSYIHVLCKQGSLDAEKQFRAFLDVFSSMEECQRTQHITNKNKRFIMESHQRLAELCAKSESHHIPPEKVEEEMREFQTYAVLVHKNAEDVVWRINNLDTPTGKIYALQAYRTA